LIDLEIGFSDLGATSLTHQEHMRELLSKENENCTLIKSKEVLSKVMNFSAPAIRHSPAFQS
jgi:hypothetical protein